MRLEGWTPRRRADPDSLRPARPTSAKTVLAGSSYRLRKSRACRHRRAWEILGIPDGAGHVATANMPPGLGVRHDGSHARLLYAVVWSVGRMPPCGGFTRTECRDRPWRRHGSAVLRTHSSGGAMSAAVVASFRSGTMHWWPVGVGRARRSPSSATVALSAIQRIRRNEHRWRHRRYLSASMD
jgi:hypothetical protein